MLTALLIAVTAAPTSAVELYRQWKPNSKVTYEVTSDLQIESRNYTRSVFIPSEQGTKYQFTFEVGKVTDEGFASVAYKRPTVDSIQGETVEHPPITTTEKVNEHLELTMSPVNAITGLKDLTPKKPKEGGGGLALLSFRKGSAVSPEAQDMIGGFVQDLFRLAMFVASPETSMDFGPSLPLLEVEPGDTWKVTASYQPQVLKDKKGKMAPQRLDYTYTYDGIVDSAGKKVHRVSAALNLDTDIGAFINDLLGAAPSQTGLKALKLKLDAKMEFDLDLETKNTIAGRGTSAGSIVVEIPQLTVPVEEANIRGRARLKLVSIK
jgi:hypothetical protein